MGAFSHPMAKFHAMDLFDIKHHVSQICDYMKRMVPSCCALAGLVAGPGERIDPLLPHWMNGYQVCNLCQLLDSFFWILDEKIHIQELAGISGDDYTAMYKLFLSDKMDTSIFPDSPPKKLPQAPRRRKWIEIIFIFLQEQLEVTQDSG